MHDAFVVLKVDSCHLLAISRSFKSCFTLFHSSFKLRPSSFNMSVGTGPVSFLDYFRIAANDPYTPSFCFFNVSANTANCNANEIRDKVLQVVGPFTLHSLHTWFLC